MGQVWPNTIEQVLSFDDAPVADNLYFTSGYGVSANTNASPAKTVASASGDLNGVTWTPGAVTVSGSAATGTLSLFRFKNTASPLTAAGLTVSDLYTQFVELATKSGSGTATRTWASGFGGGVQIAAGSNLETNRLTTGAQTIASAASDLFGFSFTPGVATISGVTTVTSYSHRRLVNTQVANASATITDLYGLYVETPTASGTVTHFWSAGFAGGVKFGSTIFPAAETQASAASNLNQNEITPATLTLSGNTTTTSVSLNRFKNTQVVNASATISDLINAIWEAPTATGTATRKWSSWNVGRTRYEDDMVLTSGKKLYLDGGGDTYISEGAADRMDLFAGGSARLQLSTSAVTAVERFRQIDGSASAPPYSFTGDTDCGLYRLTTDSIGLSAGSVLGLSITTAGGVATANIPANNELAFGTPLSALDWSTAQATSNTLVWGLGSTPKSLIFTDYANRNVDHALAAQTDPTIAIWSVTSPATAPLAYSEFAYNKLTIGPGNGARGGFKTLIEEVSIAAGTGTGGIATSANLAPANSLILGVSARITQAPGGGATAVEVGITGSGNVDDLIDNMAVTLATTKTSAGGNDGTALPRANLAATTLTLTTDVDVTGATLKVRVAVFYIDLTAPTS